MFRKNTKEEEAETGGPAVVAVSVSSAYPVARGVDPNAHYHNPKLVVDPDGGGFLVLTYGDTSVHLPSEATAEEVKAALKEAVEQHDEGSKAHHIRIKPLADFSKRVSYYQYTVGRHTIWGSDILEELT